MARTLGSVFSLGFLLVSLAVVWTIAAWAETGEGRTEAIYHVRPELCKRCHEEIYEQWRGSMHAQSSALKDPVHGAFYRKVMGDPTKEGVRGPQIPVKKDKYPVCLKCHAPAAALDKKTKLDARKAYADGVTCVTCHAFKAFKGVEGPYGEPQLGVDAYDVDSAMLYGPSGISYTTERTPEDAKWPTPAHHPLPMQGNKSDLFRSKDACMGCHDRSKNFRGTPLCLTGAEYAKGETFINCQACHMGIVSVPKLKMGKIVPGEFVTIADHSMTGGHDAKMVTRGIAMEMDTQKDGDVIKTTLTLRNRLPHSYPTGAPFRNVYVKLAAYDKDGDVLWQNYKTHPMQDDPKAMFVYVIGDVEQHTPTAPFNATGVLRDTRLGPNEVRELEYQIPANDGIAIIRAEALYNLLLPGMIEQMGDTLPDDVKAPKLAASAEIRL